jgi:hypothetical protein
MAVNSQGRTLAVFRTLKTAFAVALASLLAGALPSTAAAGIWSPIASGTTEEISALDYPSTSTLVFATTGGKIFMGAPGATAQVASFPGRQFFDVAMRPSGDVGLATADSGRLFRFASGTWTEVSLANTTFEHNFPCSGSGGPYVRDKTPTANLLAVAWGSDQTAWVVSAAGGQILKSTDAGATWTDASRQADGTCRVDDEITDVATIPGTDQDVYFVSEGFADLWRTSDALASGAQKRIEMVNCFAVRMRVAVDPAAPNRVVASGACDGTLHQGFTADAGTTKNYTGSGGSPIRDTAAQAGLFLSVGDAGKIEQTFDGQAVYGVPADGALQTKDWRAVDFADASHAAVGGVTGSLVITDRANVAPDLVAPTVTIAGPATLSAGVPATFTANAVDTGGSGVNPNGFQWAGTGLTPSTAATATYAFSSPGTYVISVRAADLAGNVSESASITVTVGLPQPTLPGPSNPPLAGKAARIKGKFVVLRVKGRLGRPAGVPASAACKGKMSISVYKGKKRLVGKKAKIRANCNYKKKIKVRRSRVGKAKKLKLKVAFKGNEALAPLSSTYKVKVKR